MGNTSLGKRTRGTSYTWIKRPNKISIIMEANSLIWTLNTVASNFTGPWVGVVSQNSDPAELFSLVPPMFHPIQVIIGVILFVLTNIYKVLFPRTSRTNSRQFPWFKNPLTFHSREPCAQLAFSLPPSSVPYVLLLACHCSQCLSPYACNQENCLICLVPLGCSPHCLQLSLYYIDEFSYFSWA